MLERLDRRIRVLVADDSALMRKFISDIINSDPGLSVVDTARNGEDLLKKVLDLKPDVVTLDVEMPGMNGLTALDRIMKECPLPVVMLSALTGSGTAATIKALQSGAVDFIAKPGGAISLDIDKIREEIISKVKIAAGVKVSKPDLQEMGRKVEKNQKQITKEAYALVLIGTSTGGPKALHEVMNSLPPGLNISILIVQHMPPGFTKSLAQRLNSVSAYKVKEAEDGETVKKGWAYVAPGDYHLEVAEKRDGLVLNLLQTPSINGHRPSVDALFYSAAKLPVKKIGVLMTGMGSDGAYGLKALKEAGALTIAENQDTCVVYGMPRVAAALGVVDRQVPLNRIADSIVEGL